MCLSCGCNEPFKKHGGDHLTAQDIVKAAKANDAQPEETSQTLADGLKKMNDSDWQKAKELVSQGEMEAEGGFSSDSDGDSDQQ